MNKKQHLYLEKWPEFEPFLTDADYVDVKTFQGDGVPMRLFIARMLNYQPAWFTFLYGVRWFFIRLLGIRESGIPRPAELEAETVPLQVGQPASFFTLETAQDEQHWLAGTAEPHLTGYLGVVVELDAEGHKNFHVITIVHYNSWAGPIYFNVILPFHHLVIGQMGRAGLASDSAVP